MNIGMLLGLIALVCGVLLLIPSVATGLPLTAIAIICLAINQTGLLSRMK